ncbi:hypothetical protein BGZ74_009874 [Mortierella antarctica]|nr:hypothetical protein BGZ74_009874 [Mortierella antarctica]
MNTLRLRFASCFDNHPYAAQHQIAQKRYKVPPSYFTLSTQEFKLCGIGNVLEFTLVFNDPHNDNTMLSNTVKSTRAMQLKEVSDQHTSVICEKSLSVNYFYDSGAQMVVDGTVLLDPRPCIEFVLSSLPLMLLNSRLSMDLTAETKHKPPFGLSIMSRFLRDDRTFDAEYRSLQPIPGIKPHIVCAHRAVLKTNPVLREFIEKQTRPRSFKVQGIDSTTLQLVINHIYLGQIEGGLEFSGIASWPHLYQAAQKFGIQQLDRLALERYMTYINVSNVLDELFGWAHQHKELEDKLIEYAATNVQEVFARVRGQRLEVFKKEPKYSRIIEAIVSKALGPTAAQKLTKY